MGDIDCVCEEGVKTVMDMNRRVLAVQDESLYCENGSCLMEKELEGGFAGPMHAMYECYSIRTGETSEGNLFFISGCKHL